MPIHTLPLPSQGPCLHGDPGCCCPQGTDGLPGSLCSLSGGQVAGYSLTPCSTSLDMHCAPLASGKLVGTGLGFCNFSAPGQSVSCLWSGWQMYT